jgi:hypothetical protein
MDRDDDKPKRNMSFEDAMKKLATTQVDPAILIEEKDKWYAIKATGKKVQFTQLTIPNKNVSHFRIKVFIKRKDGSEYNSELVVLIDPYQKKIGTALLDPNSFTVKKGDSLKVSVISSPGFPPDDFEMGSLSYRLL